MHEYLSYLFGVPCSLPSLLPNMGRLRLLNTRAGVRVLLQGVTNR